MKGTAWLRATLAALLITLGIGANAQGLKPMSLLLGPTAGVGLSNISSNFGTFDSKIALNVGLSAELRINPRFGIQFDPQVATRGGDRNFTLNNGNYYGFTYWKAHDRQEKLTYALAPIMAKINFPVGRERVVPYDYPDKTSHIFVMLGAYGGYLLSYKSTGTTHHYRTSQNFLTGGIDTTVNVFDRREYTQDDTLIEKIDFGIAAGVGYDFKIGKRSYGQVDVRLYKGFPTLDEAPTSKTQGGNYGANVLTLPIKDKPAKTEYYFAEATNISYGINFTYRVLLGGDRR